MIDVWSTSQASRLHSKPVKRPKKVPAWATFFALAIIVVTVTVAGLKAYDHYSGVRQAAAEMQQAIQQAQALAETVEELYTEPGGYELRSGLSKNDIKTLQALLDKIPRTPQGAYANEVEEKLEISSHQKLLEELDVRLENAQQQLAVSRMESAVRQAQALSEEIEGLYIEAGSDFISSGWTVDNIIALQSKLSDIQQEPEEKYDQAIAELLSITNHRSYLVEMGQRLAEAKEKRIAADETNALFEVEVIGRTMDVETEMSLASETERADIQILLDKYGDKERSDAFWNTVIYVLEKAGYELSQPESLDEQTEDGVADQLN